MYMYKSIYTYIYIWMLHIVFYSFSELSSSSDIEGMEEAEATLAMPLASGVYGRSAIEEAAATLVTFSMPLAAVSALLRRVRCVNAV